MPAPQWPLAHRHPGQLLLGLAASGEATGCLFPTQRKRTGVTGSSAPIEGLPERPLCP
jgi:hypothetical protein